MSEYRVVRNYCNCHPETCPHWNYYIEINEDGKWNRLDGSDNKNELYEIVSGLENINKHLSLNKSLQ